MFSCESGKFTVYFLDVYLSVVYLSRRKKKKQSGKSSDTNTHARKWPHPTHQSSYKFQKQAQEKRPNSYSRIPFKIFLKSKLIGKEKTHAIVMQ